MRLRMLALMFISGIVTLSLHGLAQALVTCVQPQLFPVVELLGYGYDIANGRFADSNSMRVQLFQDGWLGDSVAKRTMQQDWLSFEGVTISPILTKYEKITEGSSSRKYRSKLNVNAGLSGTYQGFTGSLE